MVVHHMLAATQLSGGGYINLFKVIPALALLLLWTKLLTWADKDAVAAHLPRIPLNFGMLAGLIIAYASFLVLPFYFVVMPLAVVIFGAEIGVYLGIRHNKVGLSDLKSQFENWLASLKGTKEVKAAAGQVLLINKSGQPIEAPPGDSPDRPAYDGAQIALTDPLRKGADQVDVDSRSEANTVRYTVDCVAYSGGGLDRALAGAVVGYIKGLAGMDVEDKRKPQEGSMKVSIDGKKRDVRVKTAGSTAGEAMRMEFDPKKKHDFRLNDLGFTEKQLAAMKESIADNKGIVILSAPKGMGLTSMLYGVIRGHDAFLEHIQSVERDPEQDLEGITQNKLPGNASGDDEFKMTDWVISQEPNAILINRLEDPRTATALINYAKSEGGHRVYVGMRAGTSFEALDQWRKLVGDDSQAVESLKMIVNGRVLRKLCMACKVEFTPDQAMLRKLGMNPEKVTSLFQARTQPLRDPKGNPIPCEFCQDLHFKGRQGVFEIMTIDDEMRLAVTGGKPVEPVFRRQRGRFLQDEALALVEAGETSIQEIKRVMRPGAAEAPPADGATPGAGAPVPSSGGRPKAPARPATSSRKR
jgi:type II secretory ATPase GspE/PulE/Tfp pilus assembly ATPase PilB-like protein